MIQRRTATLNPSSSEPCPRIEVCSYKDKDIQCEKDRGGACYRWFLSASRYVDEEDIG